MCCNLHSQKLKYVKTARLLVALLLMAAPAGALAQSDTGVIAGRLVSPEGAPVAGVRVGALTTAYPRMNIPSQAETDKDGRYRLEDVPAGEYFIVADPFRIPSYYPGTGNRDNAAPVSLAAGAALTGMDFRFVRNSGILRVTRTPVPGPPRYSGVLRDTQGTGLPNVVVTLLNEGGTRLWTVTNAGGAFEFVNLQPGTFTIETHSPDLREEVQGSITLRSGEGVTQEMGMRRFGNADQRPDLYARYPHDPREMAMERNASGPAERIFWRCQKSGQVQPAYPQAAQAAGIRGTVDLKIGVDSDGTLLWIRVVSPGANTDLARASVEAVRQWTFTPLKWTRDSQNRQMFVCDGDGETVPFQGTVTFDFPS